MVVLPEAEYERLLDLAEDAQDIADIQRFEERLAAGEEGSHSRRYVYRLLDGENRVLVWREFRGLTSKQLAEAAGISQAYLSQIETGNQHDEEDRRRPEDRARRSRLTVGVPG
jgi:DNA-directed RNA polymerase specialized sigma subunit